MKVEKQINHVERIGEVQQNQAFSIKASAKAFQILSSGVYSDIHLAIIRELSTNAWDSHIDAKTTNKAFRVHLPNRMDPTFRIRDFGTGLSHDDVMKVYTTYFESTKTNTNDQNGCLGLGSKSPFAYTQQFLVTSWFEGKKRTYSMFIGEEGIPTVELKRCIDSDEPNGIEVTFACHSTSDQEIFKRRAEKVYRHFPLKPVTLGNYKLSLPVRKASRIGKGWRLYDDISQPHAIMGWISYPIDTSQIDCTTLIEEAGIEIDFSIGDIEISADRESLQYTKRTKESITQKLIEINDALSKSLSQEFDQYPSLWDARLAKYQRKRKLSWRSLESKFLNNVKWRGISTQGDVHIKVSDLIFAGAKVVRYSNHTPYNKNPQIKKDNNLYSIRCDVPQVLMINDTDKKPDLQIKSWMRHYQKEKTKDVYLFPTPTDKLEEVQLHNLLGTIPSNFVLVSSLPKTIRVQKTPKDPNTPPPPPPVAAYRKAVLFLPAATTMVRKWGPEKPYDYWKQLEIEMDLKGTYVKFLKGYAFNKKFRRFDHWDLNKLIQHLQILDIDIGNIYGIKNGYFDAFEKNQEGWTELFSYAEEVLLKKLKDKKVKKALAGTEKLSYKAADDYKRLQELEPYIDKGSPIKKFCQQAVDLKKSEKTISSVKELARILEVEIPVQLSKEKAVCTQELHDLYPLLFEIYIGNFYKEKVRTAAVKYISLIDKHEKDKKEKEE